MKRIGMCGVILVQALSGALCACGGAPNQSESSVGQVALALSTLPTGVACIQVNITSTSTGGTLASQNLAAGTSPWTATVGLGTFSKGNVTLNASAYNAACTALTGATATWVADTTTADVTPGRPSNVTLNFRQNFGVAATGNFSPSVVDIALGAYSTGFLFADGTVKLAGMVAQPTGLSGVAQLAVGTDHACARKTDGTVWCWGANNAGQLGNNTITASPTTPVQALGLSGATNIAAGEQLSCASTTAQSYCWGTDANSVLADGGTTNKLTPTGFAYGLVVAWSLNGSSNLCGVTPTNLSAICTGYNGDGELGVGDTVAHSFGGTPIGGDVASIGMGYNHGCAADGLGRLLCWGYNGNGQLGLGTTTSALAPTQVTALSSSSIVEVAGASATTCARTSTGSVYCSGYNNFGTVGDLSSTQRNSPVLVLSGSAKIRAGGYHVCSLQTDASVLCWGYNAYGQLADGTTNTSFKPIPVHL